MSVYEVETEDGVFEVEVEDGAPGTSSPVDQFLPGLERTESKIAGREDMLGQFLGKANLNTFMPNPPKNIADSAQLLGGLFQRGQASVSNAGLAAQRGDSGEILSELLQGASGERLGELGDLVRTTDVGGPWNEALASSAGFLATLGLDKLMTGGKVAGAAKSVIKEGADATLGPTQQAVKDAVTNKTGFLDDVRSAFWDAKSEATEKYGLGLEKLAEENPEKAVSLRPVVDDLLIQIKDEPKLRNAINRVPGLSDMLNKPELSDNIKLEDAQKLVNALQSKVSSSKMRGVGVRPDDIPLLDAIHDIKAQMVEAFPDIKELRKGYGETLNAFNLVKNKIKPGSLSKAIQTKFGDVEIEQAAKKLLEKSPDILARMRNYNGIRKATKIAAVLGGGALAGAGFKSLEGFIGG